jgi:integrase/ribosomal protein L40E
MEGENMKLDSHGYGKRLETCLAALGKDSRINEANKRDIRAFIEARTAQGAGIPTLCKYANRLTVLARLIGKDFRAADKADIMALVAKIEKMDWAAWSKHTTKVCLKALYHWLRDCEPKKYPPEVSWMCLTMRNSRVKLPEELLTKEDVERLIAAADGPRDQALIAMIYESGCRAGEIASLLVKHIHFERQWASIIVDGKTGMRRILLVRSAPYLARWLDAHPLRDQPEAPLWIGDGSRNKGKPLMYGSINMLLRRAAARAGIKKRVNPHIFRHSRATALANQITEAQLKQVFGWTQSSAMAAVYVHLSGRDTDSAILRLNGIQCDEALKPDTELSLRVCERCGMENPGAAHFCGRCAAPLDMRTRMKMEEALQSLAGSYAQAAAAGAPVAHVATNPGNLSQADIERLAHALLPYLQNINVKVR